MSDASDFLSQLQTENRLLYWSTLFAPEVKRDDLSVLYLFAHELKRIPTLVSEPLPGEIRLQWWHDVINHQRDDEAQANPLAAALLDVMARNALPPSAFENMIEGRIFDLYADPIHSKQDLEHYCGQTSSLIFQSAALILDAKKAEDFAELSGYAGCAFGLAHLLYRLGDHQRNQKCYIPETMLEALGLSVSAFHGPLDDVQKTLIASAALGLAQDYFAAFQTGAKKLPKALQPSFLPLAIIPSALKKAEAFGPKLFECAPLHYGPRNLISVARRGIMGWS